MDELLGIAVRASIMYIYVIALLRLSGKRMIRSVSAMDIAATFIFGDMFDDIFWGEVPLSQGVVGITTVMALHFLVSFLVYRWQVISRIVSGSERILIDSSRFDERGLAAERLPRDEVVSILRQVGGVEEIDRVERGGLVPDGKMRISWTDQGRPLQKRDLPLIRTLIEQKLALAESS